MKRLVTLLIVWLSAPALADVPLDVLSGQISPARLDTLIADGAQSPDVLFDLLGLRAEQNEAAGALLSAAEAVEEQILLVENNATLLRHDLSTLYLRAAALYQRAGENNAARGMLVAALRILEDSAASDLYLAKVRARLAVIPAQPLVRPRLRPLSIVSALPVLPAAPSKSRSVVLNPPVDQLVEAEPIVITDLFEPSDAGYRKVQVFYATDRAQTGSDLPPDFYGAGRADTLEYGVTEVSVPDTHQPGVVEEPSVWRLEVAPNPTRHFMLQSVTPIEKDTFFAQMQARLLVRDSRDLFVYIHGFNISFEVGAKRAAQLAYDMNFGGVPVLYSWPSKGTTVGYVSDGAAVRLSARRLTGFLDDLVDRSGATTIHIVAHSMGNRALTDALELMALRRAPVDAPLFDQVVFAAPDVDKGLFEAMMPTIRPLARRLTLYASENDWALVASRALHGDAPRAGEAGQNAVAHVDVDTVDMSDLGEDLLTHVYVSNDESALVDLSMMFWRDLPPQRRCGLVQSGLIWVHRQPGCDNPDLLPLLSALRNARAFSPEAVRTFFATHYADQSDILALGEMLAKLAD